MLKQKNKQSKKNEYLDDSFSVDGVEPEKEENLEKPYDPKKISIITKVVSFDRILRKNDAGLLNLAPPFQRNFVWTIGQQSRLIESLMLNIPLPMFYVASDESEKFDVVDGLQRLTTLINFVDSKNGFALEELEIWTTFNGKKFKDLPSTIKDRILGTEFNFTLILPGTPEEVKWTIFKRINTGGEPLKLQEIRHALYNGIVTKLLKELVESDLYIQATDNKVNDKRMTGRELILRFLTFAIIPYRLYKEKGMESFLNKTMRIINLFPISNNTFFPKDLEELKNIKIKDIDSLKRFFYLAMERSIKLFDVFAFRKTIPGGRKTPINKALFETWGVLLAELSDLEFNKLLKNKQKLFNAYEYLLYDDVTLDPSISRNSSEPSSVQYRFSEIYKIIQESIRF